MKRIMLTAILVSLFYAPLSMAFGTASDFATLEKRGCSCGGRRR